MPELPEVEITRRHLDGWLTGARVVLARAADARITRGSPLAFGRAIVGATVKSIERRGKWLRVSFSNGYRAFSHLGMTGKWVRAERGEEPARAERAELEVVREGRVASVRYVDTRRFGRLVVAAEDIPEWRELGPDPFSDGLDARGLASALAGKRGAIKAVLLDQTVLAGVGNIVATEALFRARIDPRARADALSPPALRALVRALHATIAAGMAEHESRSLQFLYEGAENHFLVYDHAGEPCPRCGTPIEEGDHRRSHERVLSAMPARRPGYARSSHAASFSAEPTFATPRSVDPGALGVERGVAHALELVGLVGVARQDEGHVRAARARRSASTDMSRRGRPPFTSSAVPVSSAAARMASRSSSIGGRAPIIRAERWPIIRTVGSRIAVTTRFGLRRAIEVEVVVHRGEAPVEPCAELGVVVELPVRPDVQLDAVEEPQRVAELRACSARIRARCSRSASRPTPESVPFGVVGDRERAVAARLRGGDHLLERRPPVARDGRVHVEVAEHRPRWAPGARRFSAASISPASSRRTGGIHGRPSAA